MEVQCSASHSEYLLSAAGEVACVRVPSVHTVPQLPVSLQWVIHLRLAKQGTVAPGVHAYRAVAGDLPLGPAVGCLDNMLLLLGPTCSVFGFNF